MIQAKLSKIRSDLKKAFPEISRDIDNLIGNVIEQMLQDDSCCNPMEDLKQDLEYTLNAHKIDFDPKTINTILR
jgi:hypothetical protein